MQEIAILREIIAEKCAPTLMGVKPATLFSVRYNLISNFLEILPQVQAELLPDITLRCLKNGPRAYLLLAYRIEEISKIISSIEARSFLADMGYPKDCLDACANSYQCLHNCATCERQATLFQIEMLIDNLSHKLEKVDRYNFPHEIGVFLGYPVCDVESFIKCRGKDEKCTGTWKVYGNVAEAVKKFNVYKEAEIFVKNNYRADCSLSIIANRMNELVFSVSE